MSCRHFAICCATLAVRAWCLRRKPRRSISRPRSSARSPQRPAIARHAPSATPSARRSRAPVPGCCRGSSPPQGRGRETTLTSRRPTHSSRTRRVDREYTSENYAITLRQPLLRRDAWVRHDQAQTRANYAEQQLIVERDELVLRVGEAYLNGLLAEGSRQLARTEVEALEGLTASVKRGFFCRRHDTYGRLRRRGPPGRGEGARNRGCTRHRASAQDARIGGGRVR